MAELYTKLFVNSERSHDDLLSLIAHAFDGEVEEGWVIVVGDYEMDVRPNDESTEENRRLHPDDFLYFPFTVEVVANGDPDAASEYVGFVGSVMSKLHAEGMQLVAACDWEIELPGSGRLGV